jgi:hypothetical protein
MPSVIMQFKITRQMPRRKKHTGPEAKARTEREGDTEPFLDANWFKQRAKERGLSIRELSRLTMAGEGDPKDALGRALKQTRDAPGPRKLRPTELVKLAVVLDVPLHELFDRGLCIPVPSATCPLIGRINQYAVVQRYPSEVAQRVPAPFDRAASYVAVEVDAASTQLGSWHGAQLFFIPATGIREDAMGRLAFIELIDHAAPVIGYADTRKGPGTVLLFGGAGRRDGVELKSATPILWMHLT